MTFQHLFLKDYVDGSMDTYAVYKQADVYEHIDYIIQQVTWGQYICLFPPYRKEHEEILFAGIFRCQVILFTWHDSFLLLL